MMGKSQSLSDHLEIGFDKRRIYVDKYLLEMKDWQKSYTNRTRMADNNQEEKRGTNGRNPKVFRIQETR